MKFKASSGLFFPYLLADFPSRNAFAEVLTVTLQHADMIEVGVPFSDPVADGPVIQQAAAEVLRCGFRMEALFQLLDDRIDADTPIALMTYANPVLAYGRREFLKACRQSRVEALIVPDVPMEESTDWRLAVKEEGIAWISFVSLQTRAERLRKIAEAADGFVYLLSLTGITGSRISGVDAVRSTAVEIRKYTRTPVALGFGIKSAADARPFLDAANAFIIGSRIVELLREPNPTNTVESYYRAFRQELAGNA